LAGTSWLTALLVSAFFFLFDTVVTPEPIEEVVFGAWRKLQLSVQLRNSSAAAMQVCCLS
jgi:hypothetical protein